jgi:hypothetical protein
VTAATYMPERSALVGRLLAAQSESLEPNARRFLAFRGDGPLELQSLGVPVKFAENQFAHPSSDDATIKLLSEIEKRSPTGVYLVANEIDGAVMTRAPLDTWHPQKKGEATTDADISARCALFIDIDHARPKGTSATDLQCEAALERGEHIIDRICRVVPASSVGFGHSGNGASVFLALDHLPESAELASTCKEVVLALDMLFTDAHIRADRNARSGVEVDRSVTDPKRLCPAFGTMKRKGAAGIADRPHRRTAFVNVSESHPMTRLGLGELTDLLADLRTDLTEELRAELDHTMGRRRKTVASAPAAAPAGDDPFALAKAVPIESVLAWLGLLDGTQAICPGCGEADGSSVGIYKNGLKCLHNRCSSKGFSDGFRTTIDVVAEARGLSPIEAVRALGERFGFAVADKRAAAGSADAGSTSQIRNEQTIAPDRTAALPALGFQLIEGAELWAELPPPNYLVPGLNLGPGAPNGVFAYSWGGKSIILQDWMLSIATGTLVLGQFSCKRGRIVHIDHEQGRRETIDRYQRLARARGITPAMVGNNIAFAALPPIYLCTPGAEDAYKRAADGAVAIYVDSLSAAQPGVKENETQFAEGLSMLGRVSEATGVTVIVAGHTGKGDLSNDKPDDGRSAPRGTSAIVAACGTAFQISGGKGKPKLVQLIKGRSLGGVQTEDFYVDLAPVRVDGYRNAANPSDVGGFAVTYQTVEQVKPPTSPEDALVADISRIVAAVRKEGPAGVAGADAACRLAGINVSRGRAAVRLAVQRGHLVNLARKRNGESDEVRPRYAVVIDCTSTAPKGGGRGRGPKSHFTSTKDEVDEVDEMSGQEAPDAAE